VVVETLRENGLAGMKGKIMENKLVFVPLGFFLVIFCGNIATAETLVLQPGSSGKDAYVCECRPDMTNPGGKTHKFYLGEWRDWHSRSLIKWDLDSLPKNAEIIKAIMELRCSDLGGEKSGHLQFSRLIEDWSEDSVTHTTFPKHTEEDSVTTDWPTVDQWHAVDVTIFVQLWYAEQGSNHGLVCRSIDTTGTYWVGYCSSDHSVAGFRPRLTITYSLNANQHQKTGDGEGSSTLDKP
jgi:hypothetical protein